MRFEPVLTMVTHIAVHKVALRVHGIRVVTGLGGDLCAALGTVDLWFLDGSICIIIEGTWRRRLGWQVRNNNGATLGSNGRRGSGWPLIFLASNLQLFLGARCRFRPPRAQQLPRPSVRDAHPEGSHWQRHSSCGEAKEEEQGSSGCCSPPVQRTGNERSSSRRVSQVFVLHHGGLRL